MKVSGKMLVKNFKATFKEEFGVDIKVHQGFSFGHAGLDSQQGCQRPEQGSGQGGGTARQHDGRYGRERREGCAGIPDSGAREGRQQRGQRQPSVVISGLAGPACCTSGDGLPSACVPFFWL